jgi:hypothetical protein
MAPLLGRLGNGGGTTAGFGFGRRRGAQPDIVEIYTSSGSFSTTSKNSYLVFKVWAAGGNASSSGGGGYVEGKIPVSSGNPINIFVGDTGYDIGFGAGSGGQSSWVKYNGTLQGLAGGGGGNGQAAGGGGGGGNGSGNNGLGVYPGAGATQSSGAGAIYSTTQDNGGGGGGTGVGVNNRGGGGGHGYYGGFGGGGVHPSPGTGSGGGGGSGYINPSATSTVSYTGNDASTNGVNTGDAYYQPNTNGSGKKGAVVLIFTSK